MINRTDQTGKNAVSLKLKHSDTSVLIKFLSEGGEKD